MDPIENYLIQIEDILEESKAMPFSGKVAVDRDAIYEIIDEIRLHMPDELKEAQKVFDNRDKYIKDAEKRSQSIVEAARSEAEEILKDADSKVTRMVSEHEIYKRASQEAEELLEEAKIDARNVRLNAMDYADEILAKTEQAVRVTADNISRHMATSNNYFEQVLDTLYSNRQELRSDE
ncbi:ATPase [Tyzzerella sp. OttesenSCG-928-J15]|nr:ATPase [Tyzzerella sp. OttesenSCG-928-J15]